MVGQEDEGLEAIDSEVRDGWACTYNTVEGEMRKRVRGILDELEKFAVYADRDEVWDLWSILTALRGPDSGNDLLKEATTERIRRMTVPKLATRARANVAYEGASVEAHVEAARRAVAPNHVYPHFQWHVHGALDAIVIKD
jgi:hypothetical protein